MPRRARPARHGGLGAGGPARLFSSRSGMRRPGPRAEADAGTVAKGVPPGLTCSAPRPAASRRWMVLRWMPSRRAASLTLPPHWVGTCRIIAFRHRAGSRLWPRRPARSNRTGRLARHPGQCRRSSRALRSVRAGRVGSGAPSKIAPKRVDVERVPCQPTRPSRAGSPRRADRRERPAPLADRAEHGRVAVQPQDAAPLETLAEQAMLDLAHRHADQPERAWTYWTRDDPEMSSARAPRRADRRSASRRSSAAGGPRRNARPMHRHRPALGQRDADGVGTGIAPLQSTRAQQVTCAARPAKAASPSVSRIIPPASVRITGCRCRAPRCSAFRAPDDRAGEAAMPVGELAHVAKRWVGRRRGALEAHAGAADPERSTVRPTRSDGSRASSKNSLRFWRYPICSAGPFDPPRRRKCDSRSACCAATETVASLRGQVFCCAANAAAGPRVDNPRPPPDP